MADLVIKGRKIVGGRVRGEALVSSQDVCFISVNPQSGVMDEKNHELEGVSLAGKILVYPTGKGSTGGSYALYGLYRRNAAPAGVINLKAEPITAAGAIISNKDNPYWGLCGTGRRPGDRPGDPEAGIGSGFNLNLGERE